MTNDFKNQKEWSFGQIMAYLKGAMSKEEAIALEQAMEENEELADEVEQLHDEWLQNPNLEEEVNDFRASFLGKMEQVASSSKVKPSKSVVRWLLPYASAAAAIVLISWFFFLNPNTGCAVQDVNCLMLAEGLYQNRAINKGQSSDEAIDKAFIAYENQDFENAIIQLEALQKQPINNATQLEAKLCLVNAYLMKEDWAKAETTLASFSNAEARIQTEVEWLYLLTNIGKSNLAEAKKYAQKLSQHSNKYQQTSQRILSGLR